MPKYRQFDKQRNLMDMYKYYPFTMPHEAHITRPSLKDNKMNSNHKLSMSWRQWHKIAKIYIKYMMLYLIYNKSMDLPYKMGTIQLHKYKYKEPKRIDFNRYNKTGEWVFYQNHHTNGYIPMLRWHRNEAAIKHKFHWGMRFVRTFRKLLSKKITEDPSVLLTCSDNPLRPRPITVRNIL